MSKKVVLKGGIKACLYLSNTNNDYYIWAKDENNNKVGFCQFNIAYDYDRILGEDFKNNYSKYHNIPLDQVPNIKTYRANNSENFTICKNKIIFKNGDSFEIKSAICELQRIEILYEQYFKVGLGYTMLKALESVANKYKCSQIEAYFSPYGHFSHGTLEFYKKNGFEFYKHKRFHVDYVRKYLKSMETNCNNTI
jgi:hypothetical protein